MTAFATSGAVCCSSPAGTQDRLFDALVPGAPACSACACSRWIVAQQKGPGGPSEEGQEEAERAPSYANEAEGVLGCEHYRRNCKLKAACCGRLVPCRFCHDRASDHAMERQDTREMMCMHCRTLQPIAQHCANAACPHPLMAKYYCGICKMLDDSRYAATSRRCCPMLHW